MKFGGSSLESSGAIRRICDIVHSQLHRRPVVVVSAVGKTTDKLATMGDEAARGHGYAARRVLSEIQDLHFAIASDLLTNPRFEDTDQAFRRLFRELSGCLHDLSQDGCLLTPQVSDAILSFGERLSSALVSSALQEAGMRARHVDARTLITTDANFGEAAPLCWETYARMRRFFPQELENDTPVLGGFIGATEDGVPTTLGRGGSDFTASLVGAALNADEIQIWTDVDGMLTCDPRVYSGGYRLRQITYEEASAMAAGGAKVLHPKSVAPAVRQRIPIVIRNSRRPHVTGTRVVAAVVASGNPVKGIAVLQNLTVLAIQPGGDTNSTARNTLQEYFDRKHLGAAFVTARAGFVYAGFPATERLEKIEAELPGCVQGKVLTGHCLVTLIGSGLSRNRAIAGKAIAACKDLALIEFEGADGEAGMSFALPQAQCARACELLHREFFSKVDPDIFAPVPRERVVSNGLSVENPTRTYSGRGTKMLTPAQA